MTAVDSRNPAGTGRNLTEVFLLLRNNTQQTKFMYGESFAATDEKMSLVALDEESGTASVESAKSFLEWMTYLEETQYEFTRIGLRLGNIREFQRKAIANPSISDDSEEQRKMDANTDEVTQMLNHCNRFIALIENAHVRPNSEEALLKQNVVATLRLKLSNTTADFRASQAAFLKQIEARKETVDSYLMSSSSGWVNVEALDEAPNDDEGLTMEQIQLLLQNADMVKERERDVLAVSRSIVELNSLFKDLASMIIDQGTVLDQVAYNVEQVAIKVNSALKSVEKAERHQKNDKKMHCIVVLSITIIVLLIILIVVKT